jgi:hypothetical protein
MMFWLYDDFSRTAARGLFHLIRGRHWHPVFPRWHSLAGVAEPSRLRNLEGTVMNYDSYDDGYEKESDDLECPDCDSNAIAAFIDDPMKYHCESCGAIFRYSPGNEF